MMLWLNPVTGLSGDMLLGALLDLGAPLERVRAAVASTGLDGWTLDTERCVRGGISVLRAVVTVVEDDPGHHHRHATELIELARAATPGPVAALAVRTMELLAATEARIHDTDPASVHLHELGGRDTVVDIVGVAAALHALGIDEVYSTPVALGQGTVRTRHGLLPVPTPATAALLEGAVVRGADIAGETVTPTGAALLKAIGTRFEPLPTVRNSRIGYGAGGRSLPDRPNALQAMLGEPLGVVTTMVELAATVDDVTGEELGEVITGMVEAGAADAWVTPATMKKSRPGHVVHALCHPHQVPALEPLLLAGTGSLGVRRTTVERTAMPRSWVTVTVAGLEIRIKRGPWTAKPEHDDVARAARALGLPYRQVARAALRALPDEDRLPDASKETHT